MLGSAHCYRGGPSRVEHWAEQEVGGRVSVGCVCLRETS
jgi:hypothetical protein